MPADDISATRARLVDREPLLLTNALKALSSERRG
jgi:hypothetical protein